MKAVRFKKEYTEVQDVRLSYELVDDRIGYDDNFNKCYHTKLLGFIPIYKMEPSEDTDIPALDVFVKLSNL